MPIVLAILAALGGVFFWRRKSSSSDSVDHDAEATPTVGRLEQLNHDEAETTGRAV